MPALFWVAVGAIGAGLLALFCYAQNNWLQTDSYRITSGKIDRELRVVQLSDLHTKDFGGRLLQMVASLRPDVIFVTGDLISRNSSRYEHMFALLRALCSLAPVYYVCGNHEYARPGGEREAILRRIDECGAAVLRHRRVDTQICGQQLSILGLDEGGYRVQTPGALEDFSRCQGAFKILLTHFPQFFGELYSHFDIDLTFAGHAHGGQFILPLIGGLFAPGQGVFPHYYRDIYTENGHRMLVSRGLGNSSFPLRLFNRPQIVLMRLLPEAGGEK